MLQADFLVRDRIPNYLGNLVGKRLLDAGCGDGYFSRLAVKKGAMVEAFDISDAMLKVAKQSDSTGINYQKGNMLEADNLFEASSFDAVIASCVMCAFDEFDLYKSISSLSKLVKEEGQLIIGSNHMDSYLMQAESGWMKFITKPIDDSLTQKLGVEFIDQFGRVFFREECYYHSPERLVDAVENSGMVVLNVEPQYPSKNDLTHFPKRWGDESKIPYHIIINAIKRSE